MKRNPSPQTGLCLLMLVVITASALARNRAPIFNTLLSPGIETGDTSSRLRLIISQASIFQLDRAQDWFHWFDMEISEALLVWRQSIGTNTQVGIELPLILYSSGFLDHIIDAYHDFFGFPDYGRSQFPGDAFIFRLEHRDNNAVAAEAGRMGPGDLRLQLKQSIGGTGHRLSLILYVELPTGNPRLGFGNGSLDGGLGMILENRLSAELLLVHNLAFLMPGDFRGEYRIDMRSRFFAASEVRLRLAGNWWADARLMVTTSPFRDTGLPFLDRSGWRLAAGITRRSGSHCFGFLFCEDLNTAGATDFTVSFSFERRLGKNRD